MATHVARTPVGPGRAASTLFAVINAVREAPHVAVVILGGFAFAAIFAGLLAPHDPTPVGDADLLGGGAGAAGSRRRRRGGVPVVLSRGKDSDE